MFLPRHPGEVAGCSLAPKVMGRYLGRVDKPTYFLLLLWSLLGIC